MNSDPHVKLIAIICLIFSLSEGLKLCEPMGRWEESSVPRLEVFPLSVTCFFLVLVYRENNSSVSVFLDNCTKKVVALSDLILLHTVE